MTRHVSHKNLRKNKMRGMCDIKINYVTKLMNSIKHDFSITRILPYIYITSFIHNI